MRPTSCAWPRLLRFQAERGLVLLVVLLFALNRGPRPMAFLWLFRSRTDASPGLCGLGGLRILPACCSPLVATFAASGVFLRLLFACSAATSRPSASRLASSRAAVACRSLLAFSFLRAASSCFCSVFRASQIHGFVLLPRALQKRAARPRSAGRNAANRCGGAGGRQRGPRIRTYHHDCRVRRREDSGGQRRATASPAPGELGHRLGGQPSP